MRIKLLQFGDLHLDAPFTSLADADGVPDRRRQELKQALACIVDVAIAESVDLLLVCGDLYEHGYTRKNTLHYISDQFNRIPAIPVLLVPGNHDPMVPDSYYCEFDWPANVHILKNREQYFSHPGTGARVYGHLPLKNELDRSAINILLYHGTLDMPFSTDAYQPVSSEALDALGFDYCALGHFHTRIQGAGKGHQIYNAGSPEPLGFDEEGDHGVIIASITKEVGYEVEIRSDFFRISRRRFITLVVQVSDCLNNEQMASRILSLMEEAGSADDMFRITLTGYITHETKPDTELIRELLLRHAFYTRVIDSTVPDYNFEEIAEEPGVRGLFVRKMLDRVSAAKNMEENRLIMQALYYGLEAIDGGRVCI